MRFVPKKLLFISRRLRHNQTPWEIKLWSRIRAKRFFGIKFKRQFRLGKYIVDFYCARCKLVIELDGGQHNQDSGADADTERDAYLRSEGFTILRIWNNELDSNLEGVLEKIREEAVKQTSLLSSPLGRGEEL